MEIPTVEDGGDPDRYDDAGRLWTVRRDGNLVASYEYDANGNRTRKVVGLELIRFRGA